MIISLCHADRVGLRDDHRELTRRTVLDAVLDLVADGSLDELSVPAVARRSGVSVATIYRYFPSKDELLAAASVEPARRALASPNRPAAREGDDELTAVLRAMWHEFAENLPLLRHQIGSAAGREMRRARLDDGRDRIADYVGRFGVDARSAEGRRLVSLIVLVTSSVSLVELHDRQELAVDEAVETARWAVQRLIEATVGDRVGADGGLRR